MFWVLKRTISLRRFFWVPKTCFGWEIRKLVFRYTLLTKVLVPIPKDQIDKDFQGQIFNIFLSISFNICFGYWKEQSQWDGTFEYPQHIFWLRNKNKAFLTHSCLEGCPYRSMSCTWGLVCLILPISLFLSSAVVLGFIITVSLAGVGQNHYKSLTSHGYFPVRPKKVMVLNLWPNQSKYVLTEGNFSLIMILIKMSFILYT